MKKLINLHDLMGEQMRDMLDGEQRLSEFLPHLKEKATHPVLSRIIEDYIMHNDDQILRLKQAFIASYRKEGGEKCDAMKSMVNEAKDLMKRSMRPEVMDAALITALQHIIHYQMAGYGAICNYANTQGYLDTAALLHKNLEEEKRADRELANLAEEVINAKANISKMSQAL